MSYISSINDFRSSCMSINLKNIKNYTDSYFFSQVIGAGGFATNYWQSYGQ